MANKTRNWDGKTGGGSFGQRSLLFYFRNGSISMAYAVMSFVLLFYLIVNYKATYNIYYYFRYRQKFSWLKSVISVYRNHYLFGKTVIDKFAFFSGRRSSYRVIVTNKDRFTSIDKNPSTGAVLLQSHVGSSEIAGYVFDDSTKTINAMVYGGEAAEVQKQRTGILEANKVRLIPVNDSFSHVFEVHNALRNNEFVSVAGDRSYEGAKTLTLSFLGADAVFPLAPFQLAVKLQVPVLVLFVMQSASREYTCIVEEIETDSTGSVQQRVELLAGKYVAKLENILKTYPLQWYNFHSFWLK